MELVTENEKRKIFRDKENGKFYTMMNMGEYVGHRNRDFWQKPSDAWFLMMYDEIKNDKKIAHMDALVDSSGYYSRICLEQNGERRFMFLRNNMITETLVETMPESEKIASFPYKTKEAMVQEFLAKNQELQELINNKTNTR